MKRRPGELRIIGGDWRTRRVHFTAEGIRPTPDRVRQTTFDWLAPLIHGSRCLDLYAGSGAMGLEALSRGAAEAVFVERDRVAARDIRTALDTLAAGNRGRLEQADAVTWLTRRPPEPFEVVFVDPPYPDGLWAPTLAALRPWLAPIHRIYLEWPGRDLPEGLPQLDWLKSSRAGQVSYGLARFPTAP